MALCFGSLLLGFATFVFLLSTSSASAAVQHRGDSGVSLEQLISGVELNEQWQFHLGDKPEWSAPDFDDSTWETVSLPHRWRRDKAASPDTAVGWYRQRLTIELTELAQREQVVPLGIRLGSIYSAYELYAGGKFVAGVGKLPPHSDTAIDFNRQAVMAIPLSAISAEGELVLALRVWAGETAALSFAGGGPWRGQFELGSYGRLLISAFMSEMPRLHSSMFYILFGLYHLYLYFRNRQLKSFLWFGLIAIDIGLYGLMLSQWRDYLGWSFVLYQKLEYGSVYIIPALSIQLLWTLLGQKIGPFLRAYQLYFVVVALALLMTPGLNWHLLTMGLWQFSTVPAMVLAGGLVLRKAWFGYPEARTVALSVLIFIATCLNDIAVDNFDYHAVKLLPWGFLAVLVSMAVSLGNRLTATLNRLEDEVSQRTAELSELNQRLLESSLLDPLTGVYNRRGFAIQVEAEIKRQARSGRPFSIVLADVDHFKSVNDRFGHALGDYVLSQVASKLGEKIRDVDSVARWGGEEFILLLPETDSEGAAILAEKLRSIMAELPLEFEQQSLSITMTFGVAGYLPGESMDSCIARADAALYRGKADGRNAVKIASSQNLGRPPR